MSSEQSMTIINLSLSLIFNKNLPRYFHLYSILAVYSMKLPLYAILSESYHLCVCSRSWIRDFFTRAVVLLFWQTRCWNLISMLSQVLNYHHVVGLHRLLPNRRSSVVQQACRLNRAQKVQLRRRLPTQTLRRSRQTVRRQDSVRSVCCCVELNLLLRFVICFCARDF